MTNSTGIAEAPSVHKLALAPQPREIRITDGSCSLPFDAVAPLLSPYSLRVPVWRRLPRLQEETPKKDG